MKYKTSIKEIKENYAAIQCVPYADLQFLLKFENPVSYTCGVYGWNMDVYERDDFPGIAIATGYRPTGREYLKSDVIRKYNNTARRILDDSSKPYSRRRGIVKALCTRFYKDLQLAAWLKGKDVLFK